MSVGKHKQSFMRRDIHSTKYELEKDMKKSLIPLSPFYIYYSILFSSTTFAISWAPTDIPWASPA
jgi:archaellum biogenesis protein FlaJ (TadC family)